MIQDKQLTYVELYRDAKPSGLEKIQDPPGSSHLKYRISGRFGRMFLMNRESDLLNWPVRFEPWAAVATGKGGSCGQIHLSVGMS